MVYFGVNNLIVNTFLHLQDSAAQALEIFCTKDFTRHHVYWEPSNLWWTNKIGIDIFRIDLLDSCKKKIQKVGYQNLTFTPIATANLQFTMGREDGDESDSPFPSMILEEWWGNSPAKLSKTAIYTTTTARSAPSTSSVFTSRRFGSRWSSIRSKIIGAFLPEVRPYMFIWLLYFNFCF